MTMSTEVTTLLVDDIEAAREDLIACGVEVSEIWHLEPGKGREPGLDPERRSYFSRASFATPTAAAGSWRRRRSASRVARRCATRKRWPSSCSRRPSATAPSGPAASPHDWWDWYAAYMEAREQGSIAEEAAEAAGRYMTALGHADGRGGLTPCAGGTQPALLSPRADRRFTVGPTTAAAVQS
jgi:hypothetical protein